MPWIAGILCWVALSLGTSLAYCQSSPEDPEVLIRTGNDLRRKGDDKRAEGYLRRAYELAHTPRAAVQLGLVELALGLYQDSDKHLTEALNSRDLWVSDHRSVIDEGRINARRHLMAVEIVGAAPESTATLPDGSVLPLPSDGILWLTPGAISLKVKAAGRQATDANVSGVAGQQRKVTVQMTRLGESTPAPAATAATVPSSAGATPEGPTAPAVEPSAPSDTPGRKLRLSGIVTAAVGLATGVVGVVVWQKGNSKRDNIEAAKAPYDPSDGNWQTLQRSGVGLMVGGGIAVAAGAVLYVVGHRERTQGTSSLSFNIGSGQGLVRWEGRF